MELKSSRSAGFALAVCQIRGKEKNKIEWAAGRESETKLRVESKQKSTKCVELLALNLDTERATNIAAQLAARMI